MLAFPPPYRSFLRSLAQLALLLAGPLAPAQVKISPAEAWVLQGGERAFTAARTDGRDAQWAWTLLEGGPGGLLNPNTGLYHAPQHVAGPRACQIQVADLADDVELDADTRVKLDKNAKSKLAYSIFQSW